MLRADASVPPAAVWDIWCRVIDNHGDLGVCWRLACGLAAHRAQVQEVRLFVDQPAALAWMAPAGHPGVTVLAWHEDAHDGAQPAVPWPAAGDVVVEAFGCDPPAAVVAAMSRRRQPPVWLNLEYLSAESYVERSHGLPSPQPGGLTKWFFYPGFTPRTGGLLREPALLAQRATFDGDAWLAQHGWARRSGERVVSLFCYSHLAAAATAAPGGSALTALLHSLADEPTLLLVCPGPAQQAVAAALALQAPASSGAPALRVVALPWLTQTDYDRLLWACDVNFVRGEDSLVRALWAGAPFIWHIYPQHDGAHVTKLHAFLAAMQAPADVAALFLACNGLQPAGGGWPGWPHASAWHSWQEACVRWRERLAAQPDLVTQLLAFVAAQRGADRAQPAR